MLPPAPALRAPPPRDANQFVNLCEDEPDQTAVCSEPTLPPDRRSCDGLEVCIGGTLYLDQEIVIGLTYPELLAALRDDVEKLRIPWHLGGCEVGGFPAHAVRAARAKGAPRVGAP